MGKDRNTYAKRQREVNKKRKAEEKRTRRRQRKEQTLSAVATPAADRAAPDEQSTLEDGW